MHLIQPAIKKNTVLLITIAVFLIPIIIVEYPLLQLTNGFFPYPIDDTCIHLAIAKNLAVHHVWGISPGEFVSAASSILYPLILAGTVKIFGAHLIIPFLVNVLAAIILLVVMQNWLIRQGVQSWSRLWILVAVVLLTPLPVLAMAGMEHILQLLFTFLFIVHFSEELEKKTRAESKNWRFPWTVYLYATLMVTTRYECLSILAIACLILLFHRKFLQSVSLGACAIIPIIIFGLYSMSHGNYFFPNSVILKSGAPPLTFDGLYDFFTGGIFGKLFFSVVGYNTVAPQRLLILLPLAYLLFNKKMGDKAGYKYMLLLTMAAVFSHLSLTGYAAFPRYEAYLVGCAVVILGVLIEKYGQDLFSINRPLGLAIAYLFTLFLGLPLLLRTTTAFGDLNKASIANYQIQYQLGQFLKKHYNNDAIALEALGYVSYATDGKKLDIVGLGDIDVARSLKGNYYSANYLDSLSKKDNVKLAICSEYSTIPALLQRWKKVATWQTPLQYGGYYVSFYAVDSSIAPSLKKNLVDYQKSLPEGENIIYY